MQRSHKAIVLATAAAVTVGTAVILSPHHIGSANLYPNAKLSPGLIATQSIDDLTNTSACGTYSQCHRNTTAAQKNTVRSEYPNCPAQNETDHVVPLALGGADDVKNLWCQPAVNTWNGQDYGFRTKDRLEAFLAIQVKAAAISPKDAQACILNDWVSCYQKYLGGKNYGSLTVTEDTDDDISQ